MKLLVIVVLILFLTALVVANVPSNGGWRDILQAWVWAILVVASVVIVTLAILAA